MPVHPESVFSVDSLPESSLPPACVEALDLSCLSLESLPKLKPKGDSPAFDDVILSKALIRCMSTFIARSVSFTTFHPWFNSTQHLLWPKKYTSFTTPIRALGTNFIQDLSPFELIPFNLWTPANDMESDFLTTVKDCVVYVMEVLAEKLRIRETEFLQGLIFLERALTAQLTKIPFVLTKENVPMVLVVSIMIAHKLNADKPLSATYFCAILGIQAKHLLDSESFFLKCLSFSLFITPEEYQAAADLKDKLLTEDAIMGR